MRGERYWDKKKKNMQAMPLFKLMGGGEKDCPKSPHMFSEEEILEDGELVGIKVDKV